MYSTVSETYTNLMLEEAYVKERYSIILHTIGDFMITEEQVADLEWSVKEAAKRATREEKEMLSRVLERVQQLSREERGGLRQRIAEVVQGMGSGMRGGGILMGSSAVLITAVGLIGGALNLDINPEELSLAGMGLLVSGVLYYLIGGVVTRLGSWISGRIKNFFGESFIDEIPDYSRSESYISESGNVFLLEDDARELETFILKNKDSMTPAAKDILEKSIRTLDQMSEEDRNDIKQSFAKYFIGGGVMAKVASYVTGGGGGLYALSAIIAGLSGAPAAAIMGMSSVAFGLVVMSLFYYLLSSGFTWLGKWLRGR